MPQARSSGSKSTGSSPGSKAKSGGAAAKRPAAGASAGKTRAKPAATRSSAKATKPKPAAARSSAKATKPKPAAKAADARLEAAAQRLRKLNDRIIEAGKEAGETTLSSYEKALKAIATTLERGPGSSEVDWISHLATTQAKFIRDVTAAWTSAARGAIK
jgi:hypothetical protein